MMEIILQTLELSSTRAILTFFGCLLLVCFIELLLVRKLLKGNRIKWLEVDPTVLTMIRRPIYLQVLVWSILGSLNQLTPEAEYLTTLKSILFTANYVVWAAAIASLGARALVRFSAMKNHARFIDERTVGIFLILLRVLIWTLAIYLCFLSWSIDLTGWLASAGAVGIVLGFAAKDTLANLVSGLAILADNSYKVGDFVEIDGQYRGRVSRIGIRATLLNTVDGIQIAIPNALLAHGYVVNETAGPTTSHRVSAAVSVAYGSDLDQCLDVIHNAIRDLSGVSQTKETLVLVKSLGASGIDFNMMFWIENPAIRERVIDEALRKTYRALNEANITIPFNQLDVHLVRNESEH